MKPIPEPKPPPKSFDEVGHQLRDLRHDLNNLRTALSATMDRIDGIERELKDLTPRSSVAEPKVDAAERPE